MQSLKEDSKNDHPDEPPRSRPDLTQVTKKDKSTKQPDPPVFTDDTEFDIKVIDDSLYHRVFEANKVDQECDEIRETIINKKNKLRGITLNKCVITKNILYHKDRLWVPKSMYTFTIQKIHDQSAYNHSEIERTYELLKRKYY